ncbi:hypothetical protein N7493_001106 [Penicillium malachiteum]|uniref:DRBM domain-containing protein n=1 Tax=Penicillium malachiteum TaxID=1324776 RepID=A0AAD6HTW7_9EURO|nr:hypothetical protein N7493_001106 [Penicillium malachiteum]
MYYILYLASLCRRRRWQEPSYEPYSTTSGYACIVRVNNREYTTDTECASETLARESAAMRAYLICRNFSVNDGMIPGNQVNGHGRSGTLQGIPVAIGTGRKSSRDEDTDTDSSRASWSGGSSPEILLDHELSASLMGMGTCANSQEDSDSSRAGSLSSLPDSARALAYARRVI